MDNNKAISSGVKVMKSGCTPTKKHHRLTGNVNSAQQLTLAPRPIPRELLATFQYVQLLPCNYHTAQLQLEGLLQVAAPERSTACTPHVTGGKQGYTEK